MRSQFRPTLWPGTVIPLPDLRPMRDVRVSDDWITWPAQMGYRPSASLPPEFYLRELMALDPTDLEAVAEIMRNYGIFSEFGQADLEEEVRDQSIPEFHSEESLGGFHREEIGLHIKTAQDSIKTWIALQTPGDLEVLVEPELTDENFKFFQQESTEEDRSWDSFKSLVLSIRESEMIDNLNAALSSISVGVIVFHHLESGVAGYHTVYSLAFLQLYNHMAEEAALK